MQGSQHIHSHASLKSESVWFKTKLISQFLTLSFLLTQPFYLSYLHAAPVGGNVVGGSGSISQSDLTTTINQTSQNLAINWQSFDIKTNEDSGNYPAKDFTWNNQPGWGQLGVILEPPFTPEMWVEFDIAAWESFSIHIEPQTMPAEGTYFAVAISASEQEITEWLPHYWIS